MKVQAWGSVVALGALMSVACGGSAKEDDGAEETSAQESTDEDSGEGGSMPGDAEGSGGRASNSGGSDQGESETSGSVEGSGGGTLLEECYLEMNPESATTDCPEYASCIEKSCVSQFETCYGAKGREGDFSGGECESYLGCASDCAATDMCGDSSCTDACKVSVDCEQCLTTYGACTLGACTKELEQCTGFEFPDVGDKGCADLLACCSTLSGDEKADCDVAYEAGSASGDLVCGLALLGFTEQSICP